MTSSFTLVDPNATPLAELDFQPCGWIHGHQIRAAQARGARAYVFVPQDAASESDLEWKVEEAALGRSGSMELRAFVCTRKSGLFSTQTEAAMAYARLDERGTLALSACSASAPDHGGSWVPSLGMPAPALSIEHLSLDALRALERSVLALRLAREAEAAAKDMVDQALACPDMALGSSPQSA
jgi:hypothetical protein